MPIHAKSFRGVEILTITCSSSSIRVPSQSCRDFQYAQFLTHVRECRYRPIQMLTFMRGRNLYANTCLTFCHDGIEKSRHENSFILQTRGELLGERRIVQHGRYNGMDSRFDVES